MSKYQLSEIPILPTDCFRYENSYKATGDYFWGRCNDGVLDIGFEFEYKPVGKTINKTLMTENSNVIILFETEDGRQTWFHLQNIDWDG